MMEGARTVADYIEAEPREFILLEKHETGGLTREQILEALKKVYPEKFV
jgi:hypothetical protein